MNKLQPYTIKWFQDWLLVIEDWDRTAFLDNKDYKCVWVIRCTKHQIENTLALPFQKKQELLKMALLDALEDKWVLYVLDTKNGK